MNAGTFGTPRPVTLSNPFVTRSEVSTPSDTGPTVPEGAELMVNSWTPPKTPGAVSALKSDPIGDCGGTMSWIGADDPSGPTCSRYIAGFANPMGPLPCAM